jgi:hypothetical protein
MPRDVNWLTNNPEVQAIVEGVIAAREALEPIPVHNPDINPPAQEFHIPDPQPEGDALYHRQSTLGLNTDIGVTLIGCGGVGVWVALSLALAGVDRIDLYDGDTLSTHNLNRYPLPMGFVGEAKSLALAQWLSTLRPKGSFQARGEFNPDFHSNNVLGWIVCATDSLKSRQMAYRMATTAGSYYLEVGADGEGWSLSPCPPEFSTELEDQAGYQVTPVHVGPCMMAGAAAAYYILHSQVPVDSHVGKWDGQRITLATMSEEDYPTVTCKVGECGFRLHRDYSIKMIQHVRAAHFRDMGLAEARDLVNSWWDEDSRTAEEVAEDSNLAIAAPDTEIVFDPVGNPAFREVERDENEQA